jgi:hypothetical protein
VPSRTPSDRGSASRRQRAREAQEAKRRAERRRRRLIGAVAVIAILAIIGGVVGLAVSGSGKPAANNATVTGPLGPEGVVLEEGTPLALLNNAATGSTVDGIQCNSGEQVAYHIHTHLAVFVNGALRPIAPGIGIVQPAAQQTANGPFDSATNCYYWLHVHTQDGVIHVESPTTRVYTLGQFFRIWGQPLTTTQIGTAKGPQTVYVNGKQYTGDPAAIPLKSREDVQVDVGTVVAPKAVDWSQSQL